MTDQPAEKLRVDKWLWFARFFKTRTLAAEVANGGKIRVNKASVRKASAEVKVGDILTFHQGPNVRVVEVLGLGSARRPYEEARLLYNDLAPLPERLPRQCVLSLKTVQSSRLRCLLEDRSCLFFRRM